MKELKKIKKERKEEGKRDRKREREKQRQLKTTKVLACTMIYDNIAYSHFLIVSNIFITHFH